MKKLILITVLVFTVGASPAMVPGQTLNLDYSTYLGGNGEDKGYGICLGSDGMIYVTGVSASPDFPTKNPYQATYNGAQDDVFVTALSSTGSTLHYSTYFGGGGVDVGYGISLGDDGKTYVTGYTGSSDFPTKNPYQAGYAGNHDVFVTSLSASGSDILYSTYLGGSSGDWGWDISRGMDGETYITGDTTSFDFPTENPYQASHGGEGFDYDVFVTSLSSSGSAILYSTYLGGDEIDYGGGISLEADGRAYVTGSTRSHDFPTENPFQASHGGGGFDYDVFVTSLSSSGSTLSYSTFLGGFGDDFGSGITVGTDGKAYVTGFTGSNWFPVENPYQSTRGGVSDDAFVSAFSVTGSALFYSTYLGGSEGDYGRGISLGSDGVAYVTGYTYSPDFPTKNSCQASFAEGTNDAFVTSLIPTGSALSYSTYLGGSGYDRGWGISVGTDGSAYVIGYTDSSDFPTANPYQAGYGGGDYDAFVSRFVFGTPPTQSLPWITDYNGDGTSDIAIFRASSGLWAIREITRVYFGATGDNPQPGDYDGDGTTDVGLFRPSSGLWALRGVSRIYFGGSTDDPIPADYNGDGTTDPAIFRSSSGLWAIRSVTRAYFGGTLDEPVPGYYSGLGDASIAIFRPDSGLWAIKGVTRVYFGGSTDEPVPGDFDGDGEWRPGIFRSSSGLWALIDVTRAYFGSSIDWPIPGEYSGDGTDDIGIYRPSSGLWAVKGITRAYFGTIGDIPVTR